MKRSSLLWTFVATAIFTSANAGGVRPANAAILAGNHPASVESNVAYTNADLNLILTMDVSFALRNTAELQQLIAAQQDPTSPNYHQWLKTGEFDERFGPRQSDIEAVAKWLASEGFSVQSASDGHVLFGGNVAQAQRSFAVRIAKFGDGSSYANLEDPTIPEQFAGVIASIRGLDNMMKVRPASLHWGDPEAVAMKTLVQGAAAPLSATPLFIGGAAEAFGPDDMHTFYDETVGSGSDGAGSCIGLIGVSQVSAAALSAFDKQFSLPATKLTQAVTGKNPGRSGDGNEIEAELDVEWSHAMAPGATETLYIASPLTPDPLATAIGAAVKANKCATISISFSYCNAPGSEFTGVLDPLFAKAVTQGQSVFVSSGDQGAAALDSECGPIGFRGVNEMSADPNVTSVGGTETLAAFDQNGNAIGYTTEAVWSSDGGATGGGVSGVFAKPSYQTGPGVPSDTNRDVPDVALIASPSLPGVFLGDAVIAAAGIRCCIGGTSLSSPMMAGLTEVLGQQVGRLGRLNDVIYSLAGQQYAPSGPDNGFHDVTSGINSFGGVTGYNAGTAYDESTGWGSIDFDVFATAVKGNLPPATTTLTSTPAAIKFGNVDATGSSVAHRITLINRGNVNAIIGTIAAPTEFLIVPGTDLCSGKTIVPKKSCTLSLQFTPSAPGSVSTALTIPYNGATNGSVALTANGTAVTVRAPVTLRFPPVAAGSSGPARVVTIINMSRTASVVLGTASLGGPFTPTSDSCASATLAPHGRCTISLSFNAPNDPSKTPESGSLGFGFNYGANSGSTTTTLSAMVR